MSLPPSIWRKRAPTSAAPDTGDEVRVPVMSENDIVKARHEARRLAEASGFSSSEATRVSTAISELAGNIVSYAKRGEIVLRPVSDLGRRGITVIARDDGPGIADIQVALLEGYSTSGGLGLGLPGVRRIVDEFQIQSEPGRGTTVMVRKWKP
jgi:serine/threonine-protein kinase RsbT